MTLVLHRKGCLGAEVLMYRGLEFYQIYIQWLVATWMSTAPRTESWSLPCRLPRREFLHYCPVSPGLQKIFNIRFSTARKDLALLSCCTLHFILQTDGLSFICCCSLAGRLVWSVGIQCKFGQNSEYFFVHLSSKLNQQLLT